MANLKSNSVMKKSVVSGVIAWTFKDGVVQRFDCNTVRATDEQAKIHGYAQKIGDAAAISVVNGKPATVVEKREAMLAVIANLDKGEWKGERGEGDGGLLLQALVILKPKSNPEKLSEYLKGLTPAQRATLAEDKPIKAEIDKIKAARIKAANVDLKGLHAGLDAI